MLGEALALGAAVCWSTSVILFRRSEAIPPLGMNLFKNVLAVALLGVTLPVLGIGLDLERPAAEWARLAVSGVLGIAIADTATFAALRRLGPGLLAIVDCAYSPVVIALSVAFLDERLGPAFLVGAALVVGGVLWATGSPSGAVGAARAAERRRTGRGAALAVFGIACMGVGVVLAKRPLERGHLVEVTFVRLVAGAIAQLAWIALVPSARGAALAALRPSATWRTLLPASVLGSYVSLLLWLGGFKWGDASVAAVLNQTSSVFMLLLARFALGERLGRRRAVGAAAALAGAAVVLTS